MSTFENCELNQLFGERFCRFFGYSFVRSHFFINLPLRKFDKLIVKFVLQENDIKSAIHSASFWINLIEKLDSKCTVEGQGVKVRFTWETIAERFFIHIYPNGTSVYKLTNKYIQTLKTAIDSIFNENTYESIRDLLNFLYQSTHTDNQGENCSPHQKQNDDSFVSANNQFEEVDNYEEKNSVSHKSNESKENEDPQVCNDDSMVHEDEDTIILSDIKSDQDSPNSSKSSNNDEKENIDISENEANQPIKTMITTTIEEVQDELVEDICQGVSVEKDEKVMNVLTKDSDSNLNNKEAIETNEKLKDKSISSNETSPHSSGFIERMGNRMSLRKRPKFDIKINSRDVNEQIETPNIEKTKHRDSTKKFIETIFKTPTVARPGQTGVKVKLRQNQADNPKVADNVSDSIDEDTDLPDPEFDDDDDDDSSVASNESRLQYIGNKFANKIKNSYNSDEDQKIVKYIVKKVRYADLKGNQLWKDMELENVCSGRTWQSMKERFKKTITPNLSYYCETLSLSKKQTHLLMENARYTKNSSQSVHEATKEQTAKKTSVNSYTIEEDEEIIRFIFVQDESECPSMMGKTLWQKMSKSFKTQLNRNRTWLSLKERFVMRLLPKIDTFDSADDQNRILRIIEECSLKLKDSAGLKQRVIRKFDVNNKS